MAAARFGPAPLERVTIGFWTLERGFVVATGTVAAAPLVLVTIAAEVGPALDCWPATGIPGFVPSAAPPRAPSPNTVAVAAILALRLLLMSCSFQDFVRHSGGRAAKARSSSRQDQVKSREGISVKALSST
jgi:hypothetical protein